MPLSPSPNSYAKTGIVPDMDTPTKANLFIQRVLRFFYAVLQLSLLAATLYLLFSGSEIDETRKELAFLVVGGFLTNLGTINKFYFSNEES